jgi:hypothetical protein
MKAADKQLALRVSTDMYKELSQSGNVSDEIRRRIESFSGDEKTGALQAAIGRIARIIGTPWHKDPFAYEVFKAAIETLLAASKPEGEVRAKLPFGIGSLDDDPVMLGRGLAWGELSR